MHASAQTRSNEQLLYFILKHILFKFFSAVWQAPFHSLSYRLLEEGKVAEADKKKDQVEEKQRERRKEMAKRGEEHIPRFFRLETKILIYNHWSLVYLLMTTSTKGL